MESKQEMAMGTRGSRGQVGGSGGSWWLGGAKRKRSVVIQGINDEPVGTNPHMQIGQTHGRRKEQCPTREASK